MSIDVKEAVHKAKSYAENLFEIDANGRVTLEEVWFDDIANEWSVTVGIRHRKTIKPLSPLASLIDEEVPFEAPEYKVLRIGVEDGRFIALQNYDRVAAE